MIRRTHRRDFLKQTALAGVGFWVAAGTARPDSKSPNEKLNIAGIGVGGKGTSGMNAVSEENIVALCDVDEERAARTFARFPKAQRYRDFRKMLEERKDIDAVVVSTPDHTHAAASVMAMRLGKHVYCEKPLTHDVYEARVMRQVAAEQKVATQMGNQGTASNGLRRAVELIQAGIIGPVREVHVWTNRPIWPQGIERPTETPPVPNTLAWDLWLGPAPERPYSPAYVPFKWRGWWDFGTGALGDMACHTMNLPFMALKLGYPQSIEAASSPLDLYPETYPTWARIVYEFPARGDLPPVKLTWYEGRRDGQLVLPPEELLQGQSMPRSGSLMVGAKGTLFAPSDNGSRSLILRDGGVEEVRGEPEKLPISPGHAKEWIRACKGGPPAMSNFDYAGVLTEAVLLGNVAIRAGKKLDWDGDQLRCTNCSEANAFLRREYRKGWTL